MFFKEDPSYSRFLSLFLVPYVTRSVCLVGLMVGNVNADLGRAYMRREVRLRFSILMYLAVCISYWRSISHYHSLSLMFID